MAANTSPVFSLTPNTPVTAALLTQLTTVNGDLSTALTIFTAGANGSLVDFVKVRALGSNVATVLRIFVNNGSTAVTAANNSLYMERTIAATTLSQVAELADNIIILNLQLPSGYKLLATIGTTVAAGLNIMAVGGDL